MTRFGGNCQIPRISANFDDLPPRAAARTHQVAGAVFVTLFTIMATTQSIPPSRRRGRAASWFEAVLALIGFSALNYLPVLLSLTVSHGGAAGDFAPVQRIQGK